MRLFIEGFAYTTLMDKSVGGGGAADYRITNDSN